MPLSAPLVLEAAAGYSLCAIVHTLPTSLDLQHTATTLDRHAPPPTAGDFCKVTGCGRISNHLEHNPPLPPVGAPNQPQHVGVTQ